MIVLYNVGAEGLPERGRTLREALASPARPSLWLAARADSAEADPRDWRPIPGVSAYRTVGELAARLAEVLS